MASSLRSKVLQRGCVWRVGWMGAVGLAYVMAGADRVWACDGFECVGEGVERGGNGIEKGGQVTGRAFERGAYDIWATVLGGAYATGHALGQVAHETGRLVTGRP